MTAIATRTLKPLRRRVVQFEKAALEAAENADRALTRAERRARGVMRTGRSFAKQIHDRIEDQPHTSVLAALALGGLIGYLLHRARD
ncbi:MAG TPA: hypothetical protein VKZ79_06405 [Alphaproteobacteria bacterium]|nr:hypothetical protein [Alphaproteobacteria bacterium]